MSGFGHRTGVPISKEPRIVNERMNASTLELMIQIGIVIYCVMLASFKQI